MAAGKVEPTLAEVLLIFLVVFSLIFEFCLHHFEHWVSRKHAHLQPAVKIVYRELMVLGLVSFLFITYETIAKPSGNLVLSFEFAHIFIFLLAIIYTVFVLTSLYTSMRLSARWKRMEDIDLNKYVRSKEEFTKLRLRMHEHRGPIWRGFSWWFPNVATLRRYRDLHELMAFHDMRFQFIFYRKLSESFRFSSFLRKIKAYTFIKLVESHWTLYILLLLLAAFDILRRELNGQHLIVHKERRLINMALRAEEGGDKKEDEEPFETDILEAIFFIIGALVLTVIVQILALKIRNIYWHLTKNPRMYYEDLSKQTRDDSPSSAGTRGSGSAPSTPVKMQMQNPDQAKAILADDSNSSIPSGGSRPRFDPKDSAVFDESLTDVTTDAFDQLEAQSKASKTPATSKQRTKVSFAGPSHEDDAVEVDLEAGISENTTQREGKHNAFMKHKSLAVTNATMAKNFEEAQKAKQMKAHKYPWIIRKLIPRVNRVATPAEKMFWFGSPNFFFWCVQFTLFFSTVNLAAVSASLFLLAVERNPIDRLHYVALGLAAFNIVFVQVRIAGIMKKYTFVLLNASMVPENLALQTIRHLSNKRQKRKSEDSDSSDDDEPEIQRREESPERREEVQSGLERRKTIARFMRDEAARGNMPGISSSAIVDTP